MALKVDARIKGYGPHPARTQALVTVIVEFEGPQETMEINVLVPNEERKSIRKNSSRAKGSVFTVRLPGAANALVKTADGCRLKSETDRECRNHEKVKSRHSLSYSSWRRYQALPRRSPAPTNRLSLRPRGARSSHWYMPQRPSSPRMW
jgi:hypothetical protein